MRRLVISAGHALHVRGAAGSPIPPYGDEYDENVRIVNKVWEFLQQIPGAAIKKIIDTTSTTQSQNLNWLVGQHNSAPAHDLDVSIHQNASSQTSALQGNEVLYVSNSGHSIATPVSAALAATASWPDRGA